MTDRLSALWGRTEHPLSLALVRIALACVLVGDLLQMAWGGLPPFLWGLAPDGVASAGWVDVFLPGGAARGWALWALVLGSAVAFGLGVGTRVSGLLLLLFYAQAAASFGPADRAVDRILRNAVLILLLSRCGAALSVDARLRTGRWRGDGEPAPAWPRHLLVVQLVVLYASAGVHKIGAAWSATDGYSALYYVLQRPDVSRFDLDWHPLYPLTQVATFASLYWELAAPVVVLAFWYRHTSDRGGRLRRLFLRLRPEVVWVAAGVAFHLGIAVWMHLGIFPWGVLALYPAFVHPSRWPGPPRPAGTPREGRPRGWAVTGVAAVIVLHALPWPNRLQPNKIERPRVREQIEPWMPLARRLGVADSPEALWATLVDVSARLNTGQAWVEAPFRPLLDLTRTGQRWHLFMVPGPTRYRLEFEVEDAAGRRRVVHRTRDPEADWGTAFIRHRRIRPSLWRKIGGRAPTPGPASAWAAGRALADHPDARRVRFRVLVGRSARPPDPADTEWRTLSTTVYPR